MLAHRGAVILAVCACTAALVFLCVQRLRIESGLDELLSWSSHSNARVQSKLQSDTEIVVLAEGELLTRESLSQLRVVRDALRTLTLPPVVARTATAHARSAARDPQRVDDWGDDAHEAVAFREVASVLDARRYAERDGQLEIIPWLPADGSAPGAQARAALLAAPDHQRWLDLDGRRTALYLRAPPLPEADALRLCAAVDRLLEQLSTPGLRFSALGVPVMKAELTSLLVRDMERLFGIALLACMGILACTFRHWLAVLGPALVIAGATVWTAAAMAATGVPVTLVMLYLPAFLTCVAIGDSVHILNAYCQQRREGIERSEAITRSLQSTARPILYTAITTSCGMLGLCAAQTPALQQLGVFAAVGILSAMLLSFVVIPLTLTFDCGDLRARDGVSPGRDRLTRLLIRAASWSAPHQRRAGLRLWGVLAAMAALFVLSAFGLSRLEVHHDTLDWLPRDSALRDAVAQYDRHLGGSVPIDIIVEAREPKTVRDAAMVERMTRMRDALRAYDGQSGGEPLVMSTAGVVEALEEAADVAGGGGRTVERPWDQGEVRDLFSFVEWLSPEVLSRVVSTDSEQARMRVQLRWTNAATYAPFLEHAQQAARELFGASARVQFMGAGFDMVAVLSSLLHELQGSFTLAFVLEAATLALFLGALRLSLVAMLPNLLPVVMVLAFMGLTGLRVDIHTLLLAPIALGVVTDDTAHFMYNVKRRLATSGDVEDAIAHSITHVGRSIVINGATLTAGFGIYLAASMQSMQRLAVLVMVTIALSLLADLLLTPALIRVTFGGAQRAPK